MVLKILASYDKKTALYDRPFLVRHVNEALREWDIVCKDQQTKYGKNPEDFDLYLVGQFDDETGEVIPGKPQHLSSGVQEKLHATLV
ncbi:nonstructural protein [Apis mellifera associated microvirus 60]|nr:nonstructural protein [Apis mellifera associated microvirus 60]AZL82892.1 nonstructural protein [Apis mellifera associated microvirus 60]